MSTNDTLTDWLSILGDVLPYLAVVLVAAALLAGLAILILACWTLGGWPDKRQHSWN